MASGDGATRPHPRRRRGRSRRASSRLYATGGRGIGGGARVRAMAEPARSLYSPLAVAFLLAVAASMLVALTVTPALSALLLGRGRARPPHLPRSSAWAGTRSALTAALTEPHRALIASAALVVGRCRGRAPWRSAWARPVRCPPLDDPNLMVQLRPGADGTSLPEMTRVEGLVAAQLRAIPGVRDVVVQTGRAVCRGPGRERQLRTSSGWTWTRAATTTRPWRRSDAAVRPARVSTPSVLTYEQQRADGILGADPARHHSAGLRPGPRRAGGASQPRWRRHARRRRWRGRRRPCTQPPTQPTAGGRARPGRRPAVRHQAGRRAPRRDRRCCRGSSWAASTRDQKIFDVVVLGHPGHPTQLHQRAGPADRHPVRRPHPARATSRPCASCPRPSVIQRDQVSRSDRRDRRRPGTVGGRRVRRGSAEAGGHTRSRWSTTAEVLGDAAAVPRRRAAHGGRSGGRPAGGISLLLQLATGSWALAAAVALGLPVALSGCVLAAASARRAVARRAGRDARRAHRRRAADTCATCGPRQRLRALRGAVRARAGATGRPGGAVPGGARPRC